MHFIGKMDYTFQDAIKVVPLAKYGLDDRWYGGRASNIGETSDPNIILILAQENGVTVLDAAMLETSYEETGSELPDSIGELRKIAKERGVTVSPRHSAEQIIQRIREAEGNEEKA